MLDFIIDFYATAVLITMVTCTGLCACSGFVVLLFLCSLLPYLV